MPLVYYFTGSQHAISNLVFERLKISRFSELNDPFELLTLNRETELQRKWLDEIRTEVDKRSGLICFSRSFKNPLLWGHYAERLTGIALAFEIPDVAVIEG